MYEPWKKIIWNDSLHFQKYYPERFSPFPEDLGCLCRLIAATVGFPDFSAQAGIINYYHMDSTLGGHTGHSELDDDAPLISLRYCTRLLFRGVSILVDLLGRRIHENYNTTKRNITHTSSINKADRNYEPTYIGKNTKNIVHVTKNVYSKWPIVLICISPVTLWLWLYRGRNLTAYRWDISIDSI